MPFGQSPTELNDHYIVVVFQAPGGPLTVYTWDYKTVDSAPTHILCPSLGTPCQAPTLQMGGAEARGGPAAVQAGTACIVAAWACLEPSLAKAEQRMRTPDSNSRTEAPELTPA